LYERLRELGEAGLIAQDVNEAYELTELGASLQSALAPLDSWAKRWAKSVG
jgi:DNA-binding HxlR family transcriptional regulator